MPQLWAIYKEVMGYFANGVRIYTCPLTLASARLVLPCNACADGYCS